MRTRRSVFATLLAAALCLTLPAMASAGPTTGGPHEVRCNMLVEADLTLTANVFCATGNGFRLAPGVTLDLNGFRVRGTAGNTGVSLAEDGTSAVINGRMTGWSIAVAYEPWGDAPPVRPRVAGLQVTGGSLFSSGRLDVLDSTFTGSNLNIANGRVELERTTVTDGVVWLFSSFGTVRDSTFTRSTLEHVSSGRSEVSTSTFDGEGTTRYGIWCTDASMTLTGSTVRGYTTGVEASCLQQVEGNTFADNGVGVRQVPPLGALDEEPFTDLRANTFTGNGVGAELTFAVRFSDNVLTGNGTGITEEGDWIRSIDGNVVTGSTGTGIVAGSPRTTLRDNTVVGGGGQGILAVGSLDGGGNVAAGNAVDPQCEGVLCTPP